MTQANYVVTGSRAPDATLACGDESPVALSNLWATQSAVLIFVRHLG